MKVIEGDCLLWRIEALLLDRFVRYWTYKERVMRYSDLVYPVLVDWDYDHSRLIFSSRGVCL